LPIDRVFTIAGSGTVVTGTLVDGVLLNGQDIEIQPGGLKSRIRGLQTHKTQLTRIDPGNRVAVNLVGLSPTDLKRGQVLTTPGWLAATELIDAKLRLLTYPERPLKHDTEVSLHLGSAETMARVRLLEKEDVKPGETTWVQFVLDEALAAVNGDHYVIRSPMDTLGGGTVIEVHPKERHRRFKTETIENLKVRGEGKIEAALLAALKARQPQERSALLTQSSLDPGLSGATIDALIEQGNIVSLGEGPGSWLYTDTAWKQVAENMTAMVRDYHRKYPLRMGIPKAEINSKLKLGNHFQEALLKLIGAGLLAEGYSLVRLQGFEIKLTPDQQTRIEVYLKQLNQNP
jgi:selenocysteine-specific elongation factor